MSKSLEKLREAFTGESEVNRRYTAFALKAEDEGYTQVAKLFRAAAEAETVHALNHLRMAGDINDTNEDLEEAVSGETYEYTEMYPEFIEVAREEGEQAG